MPAADNRRLQALAAVAGDYEWHRAEISERTDGTCEWILENPEFSAWIAADGPSLLWLTGNLKSGKTVLADFLASELAARNPNSTVCSYFFPENDLFEDHPPPKHEASRALAALLHQVLNNQPALATHAPALQQQDARPDAEPRLPSVGSLWAAVCGIARALGGRKAQLIVLLDGLDMCQEPSRAELLAELAAAPADLGRHLKILLTSRPNADIAEALGSPSTLVRLRSEDAPWIARKEVKRVRESAIEALKSKGDLDETKEIKLRRQMDEFDSSFVFMVPFLDAMADCSDEPEAARAQSERVFGKLHSGYRRWLEPLLENPKLRELVHVVATKGDLELSLNDINILLALDGRARLRTQTIEDIKAKLDPNIEATILRLSDSLLTTASSTVEFAHSTIAGYIKDLGGAGRIRGNPAKPAEESRLPNLGNIHLTMADKLTQLLLLKTPTLTKAVCPRLFDLAVKSWLSHAKFRGERPPKDGDPSLVERLRASMTDLCDPSGDSIELWWQGFVSTNHGFVRASRDRPGPWFEQTGGRAASELDFVRFAVVNDNATVLHFMLSQLDARTVILDKTAWDDQDLLVYAAENTHTQVMSYLLRVHGHLPMDREQAFAAAFTDPSPPYTSLLFPRQDEWENDVAFASTCRLLQGTDAIVPEHISPYTQFPAFVLMVSHANDNWDDLVEICGNINEPESGLSPLIMAVLLGDPAKVRGLLAKGARADTVCKYDAARDDVEGELIELEYKREHEDPAALRHNIRVILRQVWDFLGREAFLETPLSLAYRLGKLDIASILVESGQSSATATLVARKAFQNESMEPSAEMCAIILQSIEDSNLLQTPVALGQELCHIFAGSGPPSVLREALDAGAMGLSTYHDGKSLVHTAAEKAALDNVDVIVDYAGPSALLQPDAEGKTCLHYAVRAGQSATAWSLLSGRYPALLSIPERRLGGLTLLHDAAYGAVHSGSVDIIQIVLRDAKCAIDAQDSRGRTALHHVVAAVRDSGLEDESELTDVGERAVRLLIVEGLEYLIADAQGESPLAFARNLRERAESCGQVNDNVVSALRNVEDMLRRAPLWGDNRLNQAQIMANYQQFLAKSAGLDVGLEDDI